jgi:hypothetical protein
MTERRFLVVSLQTRKDFDQAEITKILDRATDWVEFAPNNWLIWTGRNAKTWYERMKETLRDGDNILIFEADMSNRAGYMPSSFWKFVKSKSNTET